MYIYACMHACMHYAHAVLQYRYCCVQTSSYTSIRSIDYIFHEFCTVTAAALHSMIIMNLYCRLNGALNKQCHACMLGLDKLYFFCLLFFLTILKKSAYYSSLVYPLFQFKDVTFILKRQFICGCIVALQKVKYNPLVLSFAFKKKSFPKENFKILFQQQLHEEGCTSNTDDLSTTEGQIMLV